MEATAGGSDTTVNTSSRTQVLNNTESPDSQPVLRLRLKKPKGDKKVGWREGTVDNEHMGKKKSKCCCIYKKPVAFGESSSEDDEECEHCFGHPEKRKRNRRNGEGNSESSNEHDHDDCDEHEHGENATCRIHRKESHQPEPTPVSEYRKEFPSCVGKHFKIHYFYITFLLASITLCIAIVHCFLKVIA